MCGLRSAGEVALGGLWAGDFVLMCFLKHIKQKAKTLPWILLYVTS